MWHILARLLHPGVGQATPLGEPGRGHRCNRPAFPCMRVSITSDHIHYILVRLQFANRVTDADLDRHYFTCPRHVCSVCHDNRPTKDAAFDFVTCRRRG